MRSRIARRSRQHRTRMVLRIVPLLATLIFAVGRAQAQDATKELEDLIGLSEQKAAEKPAGAPAETPAGAPAETPAAAPGETPAAAPAEAPAEAEAAATGYGAAGLPVSVVPAALQGDWRMMVHYFKVVRFDLARQSGEAILARSPDPTTVLALVESASTGYDLVVKMVTVPEMGEVPSRILALADEGMRLKRTDAARIRMNLDRLDKGPRAYYHALQDLKYSGPYAVPHALAYLQDPSRKDLHPFITRALSDIGKPVVLPLLAALETPNQKLKSTVIEVLGNIGYPYALPALKAIIENPKTSDSLKSDATGAILKIADRQVLNLPAKTLYLDLAERYYYGRIIVADVRLPTTDLFEWVKGAGLIYKPVPSKAMNEILAAQACAGALQADPSALEAVALWASAMIQAEAKLGGQSIRQADPFLPPNMPSIDFFARAIGQQHLYRVLDRALTDHNVPVAVRACRALEDVANEQFLTLYGQGDTGSPLVTAVQYPDQRLRFAAAFALAAVQPRNPFTGAGRVVPALAEALNLEAAKSLILAEPDPDNRNRLQAQLKQAGWNVTVTATGNEALSLARAMPRIDALILSSRLQNVQYGDVVSLLRSDYQTAMTPIVILSWSDDPIKSTWLEANIKYLKAVEPTAEAGPIGELINQLCKDTGTLVLDPAVARETSLKAARLLKEIAVSSRVYSADRARGSLLVALMHRPDPLVIAVLGCLADIPDAEVNQAIADVGVDKDRSVEVRIAALKALDRASRAIGNRLRPEQVAAVQALSASTDDALRDAAGEALGGLDLSAAGGAKLILDFGTPERE